MKKRILVWPANTEIGLEIGHAFKGQTHFEVIGISSDNGPADFVFEEHITSVFADVEKPDAVKWLKDIVLHLGIDFVYPAHDKATIVCIDAGVTYIGSPAQSTRICRRKSHTYAFLKKNGIDIPSFVSSPTGYFEKPDVGSGSHGAAMISDNKKIVMEYLPGPEYTIDCLTDLHGVLRYCQPRTRARIKSGITVETEFADRPDLVAMGEKINAAMPMRGAWFFQVKSDIEGRPLLLEVGCRPAGSSGINRAIGVNLPLLAAYDACGMDIDVMPGKYTVSACRSLATHFTTDLEFDTVYCDWDDTVICDGKISPHMAALLFKFSNDGKFIVFLTRNKALESPFSPSVLTIWGIHYVGEGEKKSEFVTDSVFKAVFIDDSHAERKEVHEATGIPVFSPQQAIDLWLK